MSWLFRINVKNRLVVFFVVSVIGAIVGAVGIIKAADISDVAAVMYEREMVSLREATDAHHQLLAAGRSIQDAVLSYTNEERISHLKQMDAGLANVKLSLDKAGEQFVNAEGKELVVKVASALRVYEASMRGTEILLRSENLSNERGSTTQLFTVVRSLASVSENLMSDLVTAKFKTARHLGIEMEQAYSSVRTQMAFFTVGGILAGIVGGIFISWSPTRQLGGKPLDIVKTATGIPSGELRSHIDVPKAEDASLIKETHALQESLSNTVDMVLRSTDTMVIASNEIVAGNQDLSFGTEQQAGLLQHTAAAMKKLIGTVQQNADNAHQANQLAALASGAAIRGGQVVSQLVVKMGDIHIPSRKIVEIVSVIDDIAFQINRLASNAAVKVAGVGEQEKFFALIAAELRHIAQRSSVAAIEVKTLTNDSAERIDAACMQALEAGKTLNEIVEGAKRVTDIMIKIAGVTQVQTVEAAQLSQAITQVRQVSRENSALVEEAAAAAAWLQEQANDLVQVVSVFKTRPRLRRPHQMFSYGPREHQQPDLPNRLASLAK